MELFFKTVAGLLLLVQALQSVALQHSTDTPRRTIDKAWLRDLVRNRTGPVIPAEGSEPDQRSDLTLDPIPDYSGGITSGSMAILNEEEESNNADEEPYDLNVVTAPEFPVDLNVTTKEPFLDVNSSATPLDSTNVTDVERELNHSSAISPKPTTLPTVENFTLLSDFNQSNSPTTSAPGGNAMQETPMTPTEVGLTTNTMEPADTRTTEVRESSTSSAAATSFQPSASSGTSSSAVPDTPQVANKTGSSAGSGSSSERGLDSDFHKKKRRGQWTTILVTGVAVGCVGLVIFFILKNKRRKAFSHRKLVEEYPTDPVLRLDNSEPLDFSRAAYYNPGLQGDNIQMSNIPAHY